MDLALNEPTKVDMPLNKETKPNYNVGWLVQLQRRLRIPDRSDNPQDEMK